MSALKPDNASRTEALRLVKHLARLKRDWASEPSLSELPPRLIAALQYEIAESDFSRATLGWISCIVFAGVWSIAVVYHSDWVWPLAFISALMFGFMQFRNVNLQRCAVYALTQTNEIFVLPTLLKATQNPLGRDSAVSAAIHRLLQQVTETDIGLLNREAQETLWNMAVLPLTLRNNADEAFAFSALQALAHIGDRETLTAMQRIAGHSAVYPAEHRLNARTRELVLLMEARLQRQEVPQTLLRASGRPDATPDTLLRAHAAPVAEPPQQLLRASASDAGKAED